ncbi:TRAP transporter large permease [Roseospira visakhapatnamensis]|uniref:TRAP transporter large permease protein n=1 Tax=Roseospira visakhapatnamensis TaxID=390880 RepID=A0A7W6W9N4_9PROT|nr:TRAP transporter large permease subunit [Roseospira visakhapatnamensis]MBB4265656.1 C4-dicarboxylate transporter DctM subunit [Roseospira visakhapatnamensis]
MTTALSVLALLLLVAMGVHVAIALGIIAVALMLFSFQIPPVLIAQMAWGSIDSYALVAIPFFIFAGNLMSRGDLALVILNLVGSVIRVFRGGVALALAASSVFFAAVNGSSVACTVALGPAAVKLLPKENYDVRFSAALVAVCGTVGLMIPPSLTFILIGSITGMPITDLFIAGLLPGLMEVMLLSFTTVWISRLRGFGVKQDAPDWVTFRRELPRASGALFMPVLIIGSIYMGIFTPTEVSALAALYALVLVLLVYRTAGVGTVWDVGKQSVMQTVMIYGVLLGAGLLTALLTRLGLGSELTAMLKAADVAPWMFLLAVNVLLLFVGMFLDGVSMIVLLTPILFPMATAMGIDPIHFAVIMTALVEVATLTPPIGLNLFVMSRITALPIHAIVSGVLPFYATRIVGLIIINAWPALSLVLVR